MGNQKQDPSENQYQNKQLESESLPESDGAREITLGRKAMNRVIIGLALSAFTLNFLWLNYIFPTIGIVMILLGFRCLRRENSGFKACWIISIIRVVYVFPWLIINATIWQNAIFESQIAKTFNYIQIGCLLLLIICMGSGFRHVQKKAGIKQHTGAITALLIWYILLCIIGMPQYSEFIIEIGFIIVIPFIIAFVLIIRGLHRLSSELDGSGYVIVTAPVRFSDKAVKLGISLVLTLGLAAAYIFFSKYPMQWTPVAAASKDEAQAVKSRLVTLGFPDTMVDDLTEEDLLDCADVVRVIVQEDGNLNPSPELSTTDVAVELAGNKETWKLFHHFQWNNDVIFYGTDVIQLWSTCREGYGWTMEGELSGQVLYDEADRTYAAPYYRIIDKTYEQDNILWSGGISQSTFAEFSLPKGKGNYRGYVSYKILETKDGSPVKSWITYVYQKGWLQYPAQTAMDYRITSSQFSSHDVFRFMRKRLHFDPNDENF